MSNLPLEIKGLLAFAMVLVPGLILKLSFVYLPKCKWYTKKIGYICFGILLVIYTICLGIDLFFILPTINA